jgi:predicted Zn finger-like uncharacterized protein
MSMITGCPACGTLFKVVPDQLKISEGWVRCGHCGEVFDATASMQQAPASGAPAPAPVAQAEAQAVAAAPPVAAPAPAAAAAPARAPAPAAESILPDSALSDSVLPEAPASFLSRRDDGPGYPPIDFVRSEMEAHASRLDDFEDLDDADEDAAVEQASFVRDARRKAFWRRPLVRVAMLAVLLALAALLAAQVVFHERDRVAALRPQLRPWLERVCVPLNCVVAAPKRIEAIVIDSSGFTKLRPDAYRLSFTLKNQAQQPVAVPSLELTLTDSQDQPLARRVFNPRELGAPAETLPAVSDWSSSLAIGIGADASSARVAGYRLLAFYP